MIFTVASLLAGMATSGAMLVAARALQGAGAALTISAALSIISVSLPEHERGAALGLWAGASVAGLAVGPVVGAVLSDMFGWPWVFLVNAPLGALAAVTARRLIPESSAGSRRHRIPWPAVLIWMGALLSLVMALTEAARVGWLALEVVTLGAVGTALLRALVAVERRAKQRLIEPRLLRSRHSMDADVLSLLSTAVMCNLFVFIALYLQLVLGYSTVAAGTALLPLTATIVLVAPFAGHLGIGFTTSPMTAAALDGVAPDDAGRERRSAEHLTQ